MRPLRGGLPGGRGAPPAPALVGGVRHRGDRVQPSHGGHRVHSSAGDHRIRSRVRCHAGRPARDHSRGRIRCLRIPGSGGDEEVRTRAYGCGGTRDDRPVSGAARLRAEFRRSHPLDRVGARRHRGGERRGGAAGEGVVRRPTGALDLPLPDPHADGAVPCSSHRGSVSSRGDVARLRGNVGRTRRGGRGGMVCPRDHAPRRRSPRGCRSGDDGAGADDRAIVDGLGPDGALRDAVAVELRDHHVAAVGAHRRRWQRGAGRNHGRTVLGVGHGRGAGRSAVGDPHGEPVHRRRDLRDRTDRRVRRAPAVARRWDSRLGVCAGYRSEHVSAVHDPHQPPNAHLADRFSCLGLRPGHRLRDRLRRPDRVGAAS